MPRHAAPVIEQSPTMEQGNYYGDIIALGRGAVAAEERAALAGEYPVYACGEGVYMGAEVQAQGHINALEAELNQMRTILRGLSPAAKESLESYLQQHVGELGIEHIGHRNLADWLADDVRGATNQQLFDVAHSHVSYVMHQQRDPEMRAIVDGGKKRFVGHVQQAVSEGYFSEHALQVVPKIVNIPVYVGDVWDTTVQGIGGMFYPDGAIEIAQASHSNMRKPEDVKQELQVRVDSTLFHEGDHAVFGEWESRWFREALAEHDNQSYRDGKFYAMRPDLRGEQDSRVYVLQRELVAAICEEGQEKVSIGMVTRAHTSAGPDSPEWNALMHAWDKAWNVSNVYDRVNARMDEYMEAYAAKNPRCDLYAAMEVATQQVLETLRKDRRI